MKSLFIISLVFAIALANPTKNKNDIFKHCYRPCPAIYLPVCGYDGYKHYLFASECNMEVQNCILQVRKAHVYMKTPLYKCDEKKCNNRCTKDYRPVCGYDGEELKTFSNKCLFEYENCMSNGKWIHLKSGRCEDISDDKLPIKPKNCNKPCTFDYNPVCGTDSNKKIMTYGNLCTFEVANCNANFRLRLLKSGTC